jgi:hypothetical protein
MINETDERGRPIIGRTMLLLFNATPQPVDFTLPEHEPHQFWRLVFDTSRQVPGRRFTNGETYSLLPRSMTMLQLRGLRPRLLARLLKWHSDRHRRAAVPSLAASSEPHKLERQPLHSDNGNSPKRDEAVRVR